MNERIMVLRKALKLSQAEFGDKIGLTRSGISNVESGIRQVQERHIRLILSAFPEVSEHWLRTGEGDMFIQDDSPIRRVMQKYDFPDIVKQFLVAYDRLDPDEQKAVYKYTTELVTAIVGNLDAGADAAPAAMDDIDIDVDAETEAYRQQLINQQKVASSRSRGTADTGSAG